MFQPEHADPMAVFQLNMMGAFAQFERELIRQRQAEGIAEAKKHGVYKGRPRSLDAATIHVVRTAAIERAPEAHIARDVGISRSTLYHYLVPSSRLEGRHEVVFTDAASIGDPRAPGRCRWCAHVCAQAFDAATIAAIDASSVRSNPSWVCCAVSPSSRARLKLAITPGLRARRASASSRE